MPLNNNLRTVIAQCRNFSTRSRGKLSSSRIRKGSNGAGTIVVAGGDGSSFDYLVSSTMTGFFFFFGLETIQLLEYRRAKKRYIDERFSEVEIKQDLVSWLRSIFTPKEN